MLTTIPVLSMASSVHFVVFLSAFVAHYRVPIYLTPELSLTATGFRGCLPATVFFRVR